MAGDTGRQEKSVSFTVGVRRRAVICLLAALLGLTNWGFPDHSGQSRQLTSSSVTINGTRYLLKCRGRGESTVVIVDLGTIAAILDEPVRDELARFARLCQLTMFERGNQLEQFAPADVLSALLIGARMPAPFVIVSEASESPALSWSSGLAARRVAGFVLIHPSPPSSGLVVRADGSNSALPMDDRDRLVLAILSLFWPPDEA